MGMEPEPGHEQSWREAAAFYVGAGQVHQGAASSPCPPASSHLSPWLPACVAHSQEWGCLWPNGHPKSRHLSQAGGREGGQGRKRAGPGLARGRGREAEGGRAQGSSLALRSGGREGQRATVHATKGLGETYRVEGQSHALSPCPPEVTCHAGLAAQSPLRAVWQDLRSAGHGLILGAVAP